MRTQIHTLRKAKPWAGLTALFPTIRPATKKDIQVLRKLWHAGMMVALAVLYTYAIPSQKLALMLIAFIGGPLVMFDLIRLKWRGLNRFSSFIFGPLMRRHELLSLSSMAYFIIGLFVVVAVFPKPVVILSILCLALGDPAAGIVGIKFGKDKLVNGKSLQGSVACLTVCSILTFVVLNHYGISSQYLLFISMIVGSAATIAELLTPKTSDDNLIIPIVTAGTLYPLLLLFTDF